MADVIIPQYGDEFKNGSYNYDDLKYRHGIDVRNHQDHFQNFNRFYTIYPNMEVDGLTQYVFITRPDLNIVNWNRGGIGGTLVDKCQSDGLFVVMHRDHRVLLKSLSSSLSSNHDFIPVLMGRTESLQVSDVSLRTSSMVQPATGYEITYAGNMLESTTSCSFDITFRDDNRYRLLKMFYCWVYYINGLYLGKWDPKDIYVKNNIYDYMVSVYKIDCLPDGQTIVNFQKWTGAFPSAVPLSVLSYNLGGTPENKITIPFRAQYQEAMNPFILEDFNRNSTGLYRAVPTYDSLTNGTGEPIVGAPFIVRESNDYKLKWRPRIASYA